MAIARHDDRTPPTVTGPVSGVLRERFRARGGAPALVAGDRVVSYRDLATRVDHLAARLAAAGIGPERRAAVVLPRTPELVVAVLAVLQAGGVLVPVDPGYPAERIRYLLGDADPGCLVTTPELRDRVAGHCPGATVLLPDDPADPVVRPGTAEPAGAGVAAGNAAYLVYTSGSTGRPKGVLGTHAGLANRLAWADELWPVRPGDTRLAKSSISFIDGLTELLAALLGGARVVLADDRAAIDAAALAGLLTAHDVAQLTAVPSLIDTLAEVPEAGAPGLRRWISSGEPLTAATARRALELAPGSVVVNSYGSSEVAGDVLAGELTGADLRAGSEVTVGRPVPGARVWLLDPTLKPVPDGETGEVYVAGVQLALGYAGRPAETASRFVADPSGGPGERLYRTGDLGRRAADGRIVLLGRADEQVKIRGVRVEPGEVAAVLAEHPEVARAAVLARDDLPGGPGLVGYLTPAPGAAPTPMAVHRWVRERLPAQLVPAHLMVLDELPHTPSGKLDRRALPAPPAARRAPAAGSAPADRVEAVPAVPVEDVPPAVHRYAELGGTRRWNESRLIEVPEGRDAAGLAVALDALVRRHDALRLRLRTGDSGYWALECLDAGAHPAADPVRVSLPADPEAATAVLADAAGSAADDLDPATGRMLRAVLFELEAGAGPALLLLVAHHLAVDEASWRILLDDLDAAWRASTAGGKPDLPPVGTTLAGYGRLATELAGGKRYLAEYRRWAGVLETPGPLVSAEVPGPAAGSPLHRSVRVPAPVTAGADTGDGPAGGVDGAALPGGDPGDGLTALVLAGLSTAVAGWDEGRRRLLVDLERPRRERLTPEVDLSRTVGRFTAVCPVALCAGDDPVALLADVRERLAGPAASGVGFGLLRYLNPRVGPRLARSAPPQVLVRYLGRHDTGLPPSDPRRAATRTEPAADQQRSYALELAAQVVEGAGGPELWADFTAPSGLLTDADLDRIATAWTAAVAALDPREGNPS